MSARQRVEMEIDWKMVADNAKHRGNIYGLLAAIFKEEPGEALVRELRSPRLSGALSDMGVRFGDGFYKTPTSEIVDALGLEFTRLFIGPGPHISAHESVFTEADNGIPGLWGAKTVEVKKFVQTSGLEYKSEFTGIPDHISVELEFMQKLTEWEAAKWDQKDQESAEYCQNVQRMFLARHLLCWLPQLCDEIVTQADLPFYKAMAEVTKDYMELEKQSIELDAVTA